MQMELGYRYRDARQILGRILLIVLLGGLAVLAVFLILQMRAMLSRLAAARVSNAVNRIVTEAVGDAVDSGEFQYNRLITL
jgi:hypothetical protein